MFILVYIIEDYNPYLSILNAEGHLVRE